MRDNQALAMRRYAESARAHHDQHPDDEVALHEHHLNSLGLSEAAKAHIVHNRLASVAAYIGGNDGLRKQMGGMDDADQIRAIQAIHKAEGRGGGVDDSGEREDTENERTDKYLASRKHRSLPTTFGPSSKKGY